MPIATPISLIASLSESPAAISLAGSSSEMAEFISEFEVRMPVMGRAEESSGFNCPRGLLSLPPLQK